jgi:hypothetical protein
LSVLNTRAEHDRLIENRRLIFGWDRLGGGLCLTLLDEITPQHGPDAGLVIDDQDMERVIQGPGSELEPVTKRHISPPSDIKILGFWH